MRYATWNQLRRCGRGSAVLPSLPSLLQPFDAGLCRCRVVVVDLFLPPLVYCQSIFMFHVHFLAFSWPWIGPFWSINLLTNSCENTFVVNLFRSRDQQFFSQVYLLAQSNIHQPTQRQYETTGFDFYSRINRQLISTQYYKYFQKFTLLPFVQGFPDSATGKSTTTTHSGRNHGGQRSSVGRAGD